MDTIYNFFEEHWKAVGIFVVVVLFAVVGYNLAAYRHTDTVIIKDRYWVYNKYVRWNQTILSYRTTTMCSGSGKTRSCTTTTTPVYTTVTHTRCWNTNTGRELPPVAPEVCQPHSGDYVRDEIVYSVSYHENEVHAFSPELWEALPPGELKTVTTNVFGYIVEVK